jgi:hypothetical protein
MHGARSKTAAYRIPYMLAKPVLPLMLRLFPDRITTTEQMGRAMLILARRGAAQYAGDRHMLEPGAIIALR